MTSLDAIHIWAHGQCGPRGYGGWAWVKASSAGVNGAAGGERGATNARMELAAVVEALRQAPEKTAPIVVHTNSRTVAVTAAANLPIWQTGQGGEDLENWDLWSKIAVVAAQHGGPVSFVHAEAGGKDPTGFTAAWADLACDKVKALGPFSAAIPKPNLAKCPGLSAG
jgi:ribonuclease HI